MIATSSRVQKAAFGRTRDGREVTSYTLQQANGMQLEVLDYGAIVRCLYVADRSGRLVDVVLGFDDLASYEEDTSYIGAAIGRYANRIRNGTFDLGGRTYHLSINNPPNHLHGGATNFGKMIWNARSFEDGDAVGVVLEHTSRDGDDGYPGNLEVEITYALSARNVFSVDYRATSDRSTPVSLTQHSYFNLSGEGMGDVLGHELNILADSFTEIDASLIPTGKLAPVEGTPLDFRQTEVIGARIQDDHEQLRIGRGYDHNFVLSHTKPCAVSGGASFSAGIRCRDGSVHHRARDAVLQRQLSRRSSPGKAWASIQFPVGILPRDATLP